MEEIKDKELKDTENKKILYLSYLQILISYYFSEPNYNSENTKEKNFHKFICSLYLDMDLFYSLISVFRLTNNFGKSSNKEIRELTSFKDETLKKLEPYDIPKFPDLPILEIKISYLRDIEIHIIKSILLDILTLLDKFENKWSLISKEKRVQQFNTSNISVYFEEKGVSFNFISCDDDNDNDIALDDGEFNSNNKNDDLGGFKDLLDNDLI